MTGGNKKDIKYVVLVLFLMIFSELYFSYFIGKYL